MGLKYWGKKGGKGTPEEKKKRKKSTEEISGHLLTSLTKKWIQLVTSWDTITTT